MSATARSSYDSRVTLRAASIKVSGAAAVIAAVGIVYQQAALSYFFNDDFQWLQRAREFRLIDLFDLARYDHFYRPVIEIYFSLGRRLFGCAARPFHVASVAIHLINTLLLFEFAASLSRRRVFAFLTAVFFAVQPAYVEAVAWVAAITDLLPATWYLLTLWMHLLFLERGGARLRAASIGAFTLCLLTHESSATLLPMLVALEWSVASEGRLPATRRSAADRIARYAPFVALLAGYLAIEYVVNSRSYLIREGHYAFGWHAVSHIFQYIVSLFVGIRTTATYVAIAAVTAMLLWRGTPRIRFFVAWIYVTLAPASFFTWGNASRYMYLPAAGFALLLAAAIVALEQMAKTRTNPRAARAVAVVVAATLAIRYAVFAKREADLFRGRTRPYERLAAAVAGSNSSRPSAAVVYVDRVLAESVPDSYLDPAAAAARCGGDVRVLIQ